MESGGGRHMYADRSRVSWTVAPLLLPRSAAVVAVQTEEQALWRIENCTTVDREGAA